ncbi:MAG: head maturation protease, ClpP-related, partial [Solimonas sp.]
MRNLKNRLPKLLQLAMSNAGIPGSFKAEQTGDEATIYLYDVIGGYWGGVSAEAVAKELANISAKTIHVRINSPGGDVFEARAIMTALREHAAKIVIHVDGIAASAATSLMMAGDEVKMTRGGRMMIHEAWTFTMGNKRDLRSEAELLDGIDQEIAADYKGRTGKSDAELHTWMMAETWFSADQAKEAGFVDEIVETTRKADNRWNLSAYDNVPKDLLEPAPQPRRY